MDAEFRGCREELEHEQAILDDHDDKVTYITVHLDHLTSREDTSVKLEGETQLLLHKRLANIERSIQRVNARIEPITPGPDVDRYLLEQYEDQMSGLKLKLFDVSRSIVAMKDSADLLDEEARMSNGIFNVCLKIRKLLSSSIPVASVPVAEPAGESMLRLPKIDVPKFNGDITN